MAALEGRAAALKRLSDFQKNDEVREAWQVKTTISVVSSVVKVGVNLARAIVTCGADIKACYNVATAIVSIAASIIDYCQSIESVQADLLSKMKQIRNRMKHHMQDEAWYLMKEVPSLCGDINHVYSGCSRGLMLCS